MHLDFDIEGKIFLFLIIPAIISFLLVPLIKKLAYKLIILDKPNSRKLHRKPIPNIGGIAIFISFLITVFYLKYFTEINFENFNIIFLASLGVISIGLLDDLYNLSPLVRLMAQFFITIFIWNNGISISNLNFEYLNLGINSIKIPNIFSLLLTFFWVSGIVNAINWIDGLNGLASGVVILILIGIAKIAFFKNLIGLFLFSLILIGGSIGFLFHNLRPNNIIMGDNGSNFLGFQLSLLSLYAGSNNKDVFHSSDLTIFPIIPILLLGFPLLDMVRVILKRIKNKSTPFLPDRNHFHHILIDNNLSHKEVLFLIFSITFYLISISFLFTGINNKIIIFASMNFILFIEFMILRKKFDKLIK